MAVHPPGPGVEAVQKALKTDLMATLEEHRVRGKVGDTFTFPTLGRIRAKTVQFVGLGFDVEGFLADRVGWRDKRYRHRKRRDLERVDADEHEQCGHEKNYSVGQAEPSVVTRRQILAPIPAEALSNLVRERECDLGGGAEAGDEQRTGEDREPHASPWYGKQHR